MHLMGHDDMVGRYAQLGSQMPAVFSHMLGIVAAILIDIEFAVVALAHSALAGGGESLDP